MDTVGSCIFMIYERYKLHAADTFQISIVDILDLSIDKTSMHIVLFSHNYRDILCEADLTCFVLLFLPSFPSFIFFLITFMLLVDHFARRNPILGLTTICC